MSATISTPPPAPASHPPAAFELPMLVSEPPRALARARRDFSTPALVLGFALCAAALFVASLQQPWWRFKLYAPQYPHGLTLVISLTGLAGDVREVDNLNHYIGMAHLDSAAVFERRYAPQAVALLCAAVLALAAFARGRYAALMAVAGALFPLGFAADCWYWLHRFGHALDPHAPLHIPAFTPQLFGNGSIGQFMTFALPERGFWLAVAGAAVLVIAAIVRMRADATSDHNQPMRAAGAPVSAT